MNVLGGDGEAARGHRRGLDDRGRGLSVSGERVDDLLEVLDRPDVSGGDPAGIGVGVSSSVIPYVTDQLAMARLPRATTDEPVRS